MRHMKTHKSSDKFVPLLNSYYLTTRLTLHWSHVSHVARSRGRLRPIESALIKFTLLSNSLIVIDAHFNRNFRTLGKVVTLDSPKV